jgi:hypothetical protein
VRAKARPPTQRTPASAGQRRCAVLTRAGILALLGVVSGACTTTAVAPIAALPEDPPPYVGVPHPDGSALGDLMGVFTERGAPSPTEYAGCDKTFQELRGKTVSKEEIEQGVRELVRADPVFYHWCFYTKLYEMEEGLRKDEYLDDKQKRVLEAYLFLTPISRGFMAEYNDSRYYRWAVVRYRKLSEHVFFRKVELSPQAANELMGATSTLGVQRRDGEEGPVLEKYGLAPMPKLEHGPASLAPATGSGETSRDPAAVDPAVGERVPAVAEETGGAMLLPESAPGTEPEAGSAVE